MSLKFENSHAMTNRVRSVYGPLPVGAAVKMLRFRGTDLLIFMLHILDLLF